MGKEEKKKKTTKMKTKKPTSKDEPISDERFAAVMSDPRFMEAPKKKSKVPLDSRFRRVLTDPSFLSSNAPIDKRGRPKDNNSAAHALKRFYHLSSDDDESEEESSEGLVLSENENESSTDDEDYDVGSDEEEEEEEEYNFLQPEEDVPEIEKGTRRLAIVNLDWTQIRAVDLYVLLSSFLPKDGQILSVSVYPSEFGLKRMEEEAVHGPLLFDGEKKRNDEEEDDDEDEDDDDDDDEIDNKRLRAYELSRLRYYYAVVECDSIDTADYLYKECDGTEVERSANKLDLRFIPDTMEFKHPPRDVATEAPTNYEGLLDFETKALTKSDVPLTWEEEDELPRKRAFRRIFNSDKQGDLDLNEYLASDESDTDAEDNADATENNSEKKQKKRERYLSLIQSGDGSDEDDEGKADDQDMEVTFNSGLEDISKRILEKKDKKSESVWDAYLRKKKEKKKMRKNRSKNSSDDDSSGTDEEVEEQPDDFFLEEPSTVGSKGKRGNSSRDGAQDSEATTAELELLLADEKISDTHLKGYKLKSKKSKRKKGEEIPDESNIPTVDYSDPRFSALLTSPLFAVDPTDPQFKRSATYLRQMTLKRKMGDQENERQIDHPEISGQASAVTGDEPITKSEVGAGKKEKSELSLLIKSVKMKSKQNLLPSQPKVPRKHENLLHKAKKRKQEN